MKKSILAIAVAATMAAPAAMAAPTVYGNIHLTIHQFDKSDGTGAGTNGNLNMASHTSSIGAKGSEDLGNGLKAIYKAEFQLAADGDSANGDALTQRDVFAGLKGGWGTVKVGAFSSNYKQYGGKVDSLYRTPAEGRGFIQTQSSQLHGGRGTNRGRMTNQLAYTTPTMGGFSLVANVTTSDSDDETTGVGLRWSNKSFLVYGDWIDTTPTGVVSTNTTESAMKIGGKWSGKAFFVAAQVEDTEDLTDYNFMHLNGGWLINANNILTATYGTKGHVNDSNLDTAGLALAYDHKLSKMTDVYVAYMDKSSDTAALEDSAFALGIRKKF
jgi:predicted porin